MKNKKIVVALGRTAFGELFPEQKKAVGKAALAIADIAEEKYKIAVTYSNGPQIGMIHTAMTEFSRLDSKYTVAPMSVCGALSQGYIGYDLQNAIRTELLNRGIYKTVASIITQTRVDSFDEAFYTPTKTIGRLMNENEAEDEVAKGNYVVRDGDKYRRIVAAPKPIDIYEIDAIKTLVDAGQIVIAAGGGGIPVLQQGTRLKGASAVIEKDAAAGLMADMLGADTLLFLTAEEYAYLDYNTENAKPLKEITADMADEYIKDDHFACGSMLPKLEAAIEFVKGNPDRTAVIASISNAKAALNGKTGTIIRCS